jgi:uncharacterized protein (TIGR02453 family)
MARARHFSPALFDFLRDLEHNNDRDWFQANKTRYEQDVKQPALAFIIAFAPLLGRISAFFRADPRPQGGSLFRIYRDIRFSKDKKPYKTHTGLHFRHVAGRDVHAPGFYLHLEPGNCFVGVGLWRPDNAALNGIRRFMAGNPERWRQTLAKRGFHSRFEVSGESLKRPPQGYSSEHPLIEWLKLKDITALAPLREADVTGTGFLEKFAADCRAGAPLVKYLCEALAIGF